MLTIAHILNFLGMILLPILLGIWLVRRFKLSGKLLLAGALTFIASQVLHIPLVYALAPGLRNGTLVKLPEAWLAVFYALVLGLLAGIFEETARWILYKFILRKANTWEEGVTVGAGHGGIEALLLGVSAALAFFQLLAYRGVDPAGIPGIPADQLEMARQQITQYWSLPPYMAIMGFVERLSAICLHLSLSVMVLYAIVRKQPVWFWLALLWHAAVDAAAVFLVERISIPALEGVVGVMAIISLAILFWLRPRFPRPEVAPEPAIVPAPV